VIGSDPEQEEDHSGKHSDPVTDGKKESALEKYCELNPVQPVTCLIFRPPVNCWKSAVRNQTC
jgi:hypothetical protein